MTAALRLERSATCHNCKTELTIQAPGPGRYQTRCARCDTTGLVVITVDEAARIPIRKATQFEQVTRLDRLSRFENVLHKFEDVAHYVPEARWQLLAVYLGLVGFAEVLVATVNPLAGLVVHATVMLSLLAHAGFLAVRSEPASRMALVMSLLPLVRIVSLTTPLSRFSYFQWFILLGAVLYGAVFATIRLLKPSAEEVRLVPPAAKHVPLEVGVALAGVGIGFAEYTLIKPGAVLPDASLVTLLGPALLLIAATGLLEETLFRGLLPRYISPVMGATAALVVPAAAQAVMGLGFLNPLHVGLVFATGLFYGVVARKTGSILGIGVSHGLANVMLFLVLPLTMG